VFLIKKCVTLFM